MMPTKKEIDLRYRARVFMVFRAWKQAGGGPVALADLARVTGLGYSRVRRYAKRLGVPLDYFRHESGHDRVPVDVAIRLNSERRGVRHLGREG